MMGNYQVRFLGEGNAATRVLLPDWGGWGETPVPTRSLAHSRSGRVSGNGSVAFDIRKPLSPRPFGSNEVSRECAVMLPPEERM